MEKIEAPRNRIKWVHSQEVADEDSRDLKEWADGAIPIGIAITKIAKSNHLDILNGEDFVENAHWLGYFRPSERL